MAALDEFKAILEAQAPLKNRTGFAVGGPAEWLASPGSPDEAAALIRRCRDASIPCRVLGGGWNILAPDEGVKGVVISLAAPAFGALGVSGTRVTAGAGVALSDLIAAACKANLSGLEGLVAIPGSVGGALVRNVGDRAGDIGQHVHSVSVITADGELGVRYRADIRFGYRDSNLDDGLVVAASFDLDQDDPSDIVRRVKRTWIAKKAAQPLEFEAAGYVFRNPRGLDAGELIEKAGLRGARVGAAELSDRNPRFVVAHSGATAAEIKTLIDQVLTKVEQRLGVAIELQIDIW